MLPPFQFTHLDEKKKSVNYYCALHYRSYMENIDKELKRNIEHK